MKQVLANTLIVTGAATLFANGVEATATSTYTVKKGDSLASIARAHQTSTTKLQKLNDMSGPLIYVGQKLKVTGTSSETVTQAKKAGTTNDSSYTVKSGDSLSVIALRTGMNIATLKSLNDLSSDTIFVGQKLKLKGATSTKAATASYKKSTPKTTKVSNPTTTTSRSVTTLALKFQGVPYVWGGSSTNGFDCSGFIYYVFKNSGYNISRTSVADYRKTIPTVSANDLRAGDVVFFKNTYKEGITHMGIYLGGGQFIHAGTSSGVAVTSMYDSYWSKHLHSYGRFSR